MGDTSNFDKEKFTSLAKEVEDLFVEEDYKFRVSSGQHQEGDNDTGITNPPPAPSEWKDAIRSSYSWIPDALEDLICPEPTNLDNSIQKLKDVREMFSASGSDDDSADDAKGDIYAGTTVGLDTDIAYVENLSGKWNGAAAIAFQDHVVSEFRPAAKNAKKYANALLEHYEAARLLYKESREDLWDLAQNTKLALKQMPNDEKDVNLAMGAAIATIAAGATAASAGIAGTFTILAGVLSAGAAKDQQTRSPLGGRNVDAVYENFVNARNKFQETFDAKENKLVKRLEGFDRLSEAGDDGLRYKGIVVNKPGEVKDFGKPPKNKDYHDEFRVPASL